MEVAGREATTVGDTFPPLLLICDMNLGAEQIEALAKVDGDELAYRWVQSQVQTIGDLLPVSWDDVDRWPQAGPGRRDGLMSFLAKLSAEAPSMATGVPTKPDNAELIRDAEARTNQTREWRNAIETLGAWAATVAGGSTWGDFFALAPLSRSTEVDDAWSVFSTFPVPLGGRVSGQDRLAGYLDQMDDRRRTILVDRTIGPNKRTLDELGSQLGLTRERVRQIESTTITELHRTYDESADWRCVHWATGALRSGLGAVGPLESRRDLLPGTSDLLRRVITWLAGYRYEGDFLIAAEYQMPRIADLPRLIPGGRVVDEYETSEAMLAAGVNRDLLELVIESIEGVARIDGQLVDWTGGQEARAMTVLELRDEPQTVEDLFELAGGSSMTSFRNRVFESDRIIRVTKNKVGLRSWGGTRYTSIVDLMVERLTSGPREIHELAEELVRTYEVSANSVVMYAYAPAFKITGDVVALRGRHDPFIPRDRPDAVHGLFRIDLDTLHWHVDVDADLLRGSGQALPQEIGTFLGISPGDGYLNLRGPSDDVLVTWSESSITGPSLGSLRMNAQQLGAVEGDVLRLIFVAGSDVLAVSRVQPASDDESPSEALRRLTGLPDRDCHDLRGLAAAISCRDDEAVDALVKRKDTAVAAAAEKVCRSRA